MSTLTINADFHSWELGSLPLPVDICRMDLTRLKTVSVGETVELADGEYLLRLTLPAGIQVTAITSVPKERQVTLKLGDWESPRELEEVQRFVRGAIETASGEWLSAPGKAGLKAGVFPVLTRDLGDLFLLGKRGEDRKARSVARTLKTLGFGGTALEANRIPRLRVFSGDPLKGECEERSSELLLRNRVTLTPTSIQIQLPPSITLIQLLQRGAAPVNTMLPNSPGDEGAIIVFQSCDDGGFLCTVHAQNVVADSLFSYQRRGLAGAAQAMANSYAEKLLHDKVKSPIGAVVGAYTLLRLGQLERLHNWTKNLFDWFPNMPDPAVIYAEHLARLGEHAEALQCLIALTGRGLPVFVEGLSYAIDRLERYTKSKDVRLSSLDVHAGAELLQSLRRFAAYADLRKQTLSYTGLNPIAPDDKAESASQSRSASAAVLVRDVLDRS